MNQDIDSERSMIKLQSTTEIFAAIATEEISTFSPRETVIIKSSENVNNFSEEAFIPSTLSFTNQHKTFTETILASVNDLQEDSSSSNSISTPTLLSMKNYNILMTPSNLSQ